MSDESAANFQFDADFPRTNQSDINDRVNRVDASLDRRDSLTAVVQHYLTSDERDYIAANYPTINVSYGPNTGAIQFGHVAAAVARTLDMLLLLREVNAAQDSVVPLVCWGFRPPDLKQCRVGARLHLCAPDQFSSQAPFRRTDDIPNNPRYVANLRNSAESCKDIYSCTTVSTNILALHTLYDTTPREAAALMMQHYAERLVGVFYFSPEMLFKDQGFISGLGLCWWRSGDYLVYSFKSDACRNYRHKWSTMCAWIKTSIVDLGDDGVFNVEATSLARGTMTINMRKIKRPLCAPLTVSRSYFTHATGLTMIRTWHPKDSENFSYYGRAWLSSLSGEVTRYGDVRTLFLPTALIDAALARARGQFLNSLRSETPSDSKGRKIMYAPTPVVCSSLEALELQCSLNTLHALPAFPKPAQKCVKSQSCPESRGSRKVVSALKVVVYTRRTPLSPLHTRSSYTLILHTRC